MVRKGAGMRECVGQRIRIQFLIDENPAFTCKHPMRGVNSRFEDLGIYSVNHVRGGGMIICANLRNDIFLYVIDEYVVRVCWKLNVGS